MLHVSLIPLTDEELDSLSVEGLVARMDHFLATNRLERYGAVTVAEGFSSRPTVAEFVATNAISQQSDDRRRALAHLCFGFLIQLELCEVAGGMANRELYNHNFNAECNHSPAFRLRDGVFWQYDIVASRMAMEVFMDLLYSIDTGKRIQWKKSKIGEFRKWLQRTDNRFVYFAHVLLGAYQFDRKHRTPEIHGASKLPRRFLLMQTPDSETRNESVTLMGALMNVWHPLIVLLEGGKPIYMNVGDEQMNWFNSYQHGTPTDVDKAVKELLAEIG